MPNAELTREVIETSRHLLEASRSGDIDGADVARELDYDGPEIDLYYSFREAVRLGAVEVAHWRGALGLPSIVRLP